MLCMSLCVRRKKELAALSYNLFTPSWNILGCPKGVKNSSIQIFQKDSLVDGFYCGHSMPGDIMQCFTLGLILKENLFKRESFDLQGS